MGKTLHRAYFIGNPRKRLVLYRSFSRAGTRIRLSGPVGFAIVYFRDWKKGTGHAFKTIDQGATVTGGVADKIGYKRIAYIAHLNIDPKYQGKGYGGEIMKILAELDPTVDLYMLCANADTEELTPKLHDFYRRCGFTAWPDKDYIFYRKVSRGPLPAILPQRRTSSPPRVGGLPRKALAPTARSMRNRFYSLDRRAGTAVA